MTDDDLKKILEDEWRKHRPPIPMGERRLELAVAAMRRAYDAGVAAEVKKQSVRDFLEAE